MNTNKQFQLLWNTLRTITIIILIFTNLVGIVPAKPVYAQDEIIDIYDDGNGGDCSLVGNWDSGTKTCQLTKDVYVTISIGGGITLDGNGFSVIGPWQDTRAIVLLGENITIRNINARDFGYCVFSGYKAHYLTITNSTFEHCEMHLSGNNMRIEGNHISGGEGRGIELQGSNNSIIRNSITNNSQGGILMYESDNNLISENNILNTTEGTFFYGMWVQWSDGNIIENNNIQGRYSSGINVDFSVGNTVRNNLITEGTYGLNISRQSTSNVFYKNTVQENWMPLTIGESIDNRFYDNNFIDNGDWMWIQPGNIFQLDLPIGGNYWSSFDNRFEGCFDLNMDGLCDSPYIFEGGQDDLPWTRPDKSINQTPVANAGETYTVQIGNAITLNASASSDPDGDPLSYDWDLDNDGQYDDATDVTTTTVFNQAGEYTVGLRVADLLGLTSTDTTTITVSENLASFRVFVEPNEDNVFAWGWPAGTLLTLTIDDPATTSQTPDYTTTQAASGTDGWEHGFWLGGIFDIQPGFVVTVSGGGHVKQHIVTHLTISNINIDTDTVSGIGYPGSYVHVGTICDENSCANRNITVDADGNWLANFSIPESGNPDAGMMFDLRPGLGSSVYEHDTDNDSTKVNWNVPIDSNPPTITWVGDISNGHNYYFGFVPSEPTCTASDLSGVDGPCTVTGYSTTIGVHTLTATAKDIVGNVATETKSYTVTGWTLKGFYQPVDMNGVYNLIKGGSTVPFKFEVFAGSTELTDIANIRSFTYAPTFCDANAKIDEIETTVTSGTSLRYADGQFVYNWKTPNTAGKCYRVTMTTIDGSTLIAYFKFK